MQTLVDVVSKYIEEIGITATTFAGLAGRTQSNFLDFYAAVEDLGVEWLALVQYKERADEIPFVGSLPNFPLNKPVLLPSYFEDQVQQSSEVVEPCPPNIPPFLPPIPPKRTYRHTPGATYA